MTGTKTNNTSGIKWCELNYSTWRKNAYDAYGFK